VAKKPGVIHELEQPGRLLNGYWRFVHGLFSLEAEPADQLRAPDRTEKTEKNIDEKEHHQRDLLQPENDTRHDND
jgi:site-specific recombinase XerC